MSYEVIQCKYCGNQINKNAKYCPYCRAKNRKPVIKRWWFWVLVLIIIIKIASGSGVEKNHSKTVAGQPTIKATTKTPTKVTVDELVAALNENALKASNTYKGMYVELTGKLSNIDASGKYFSLDVTNNDFNLISVMCYIEKEHEATVANFKKDQEVTVVGTITNVGEVLGYSVDVESLK